MSCSSLNVAAHFTRNEAGASPFRFKKIRCRHLLRDDRGARARYSCACADVRLRLRAFGQHFGLVLSRVVDQHRHRSRAHLLVRQVFVATKIAPYLRPAGLVYPCLASLSYSGTSMSDVRSAVGRFIVFGILAGEVVLGIVIAAPRAVPADGQRDRHGGQRRVEPGATYRHVSRPVGSPLSRRTMRSHPQKTTGVRDRCGACWHRFCVHAIQNHPIGAKEEGE